MGRLEDGRVAFARLTAPGDLVRILYPDSGGRFVRATSVEIVEPGPGRVVPECGVFGRCGGCAWQHVAYRDQLDAKSEILRAAVARIGGIESLPEIVMIASPQPYGYRGRTRLLVEGPAVGYRRWHTNDIEPIDHCPILLPCIESELERLATELRVRPASSKPGVEWELAAGSDGSVRAVSLSPSSVPEPTADKIEIEVSGERVGISPGGFAQGNALAFEILYSHVAEALEGAACSFLLELYAGAGFFTLPLARRYDRVTAVECDAGAVADLTYNLRSAGLSNVEIVEDRVDEALANRTADRPDAVLLDPPRTGLTPGAAATIARLQPRRIVYVSCDPATLARDLAHFTQADGDYPNYTLVRLTGIDLFPQTPHLEAVAVLDSANGRPPEHRS